MLTEGARKRHFLNEVGACGRILLAHNSTGLWPLQECRRAWQRAGHDWGYADLVRMAADARPWAAVVNPDAEEFYRPGDMPDKITNWCRATGQRPPADPGAITRCLLEGLALRYRKAVEDLTALTGRTLETVHLVGGGSRNPLLCQLAADATERQVVAGPVEATAIGTLTLQAMAHGRLSSLAEICDLVERSFDLTTYEPRTLSGIDVAYRTFLEVEAAAGKAG